MSCSCGPDWLPSKITHWYLKVPPGEVCFFHEACLVHDSDYVSGELSKGDCDTKFLVSMIHLALKAKASDKQIKRAISYYFWVKHGGYISYYRYRLKELREAIFPRLRK